MASPSAPLEKVGSAMVPASATNDWRAGLRVRAFVFFFGWFIVAVLGPVPRGACRRMAVFKEGILPCEASRIVIIGVAAGHSLLRIEKIV